MKMLRYTSVLLAILGTFLLAGSVSATAQIQVDSTNPSAAPQGTINLDVTISGNGFKKGVKAQWFVTGTTNPGGVTVNSTTFKGSTQLTANITVATDAVISGFDIVVTNTDGRTGKGTDKFAVTQKGTPIGCTTSGTPSGFTLVTQLNPVQANGAALITTLRLGNAIRVRPLDLNRDGIVDTLVAFVTSGQTGSEATYVFLLDPTTGLPQANNPVTGAAWQNPLVLLTGAFSTVAEAGDVNGDGVPDFLMLNSLYLFVGSVSGANAVPPFTLSYTAYPIHAPAGAPSNFGTSIALGDLDGDGSDEIVVGAAPGKRDTSIAAVFIYKYVPGANGGPGSVNYVQKIQDPPGTGEGFGSAIAIGNIDGLAGNELVVGAPGASTPGGGIVYVFPAPLQQSSYFSLTGPGPTFGEGRGIADVNLDGFPDLVVNTGDKFSGSDTTAKTLIFSGNVHAGATYTNQLLPATGLAYSWAAPNSDVAAGVVAVGTPNASTGTCSSIKGGVGAVHLFTSPFGSSQYPNYVFGPPTLAGSSQFSFGYGVGVVPGYPFVLVGAHLQDVGTTSNAGQVYVYKKN
jgi:hypothetical protein